MKSESISPCVELLRVEEVARMLGISKRSVWRLVAGKELPEPVSIGRCRRWHVADVRAFIQSLKG